MAEIGCSLTSNIIYLKKAAEKGNIQKNWYARILDNASDHLFTPCCVHTVLRCAPVFA